MALNRVFRLRKASEFSRVRQQGRSLASRLLVLAWMPNEENKLRIGFIVSKRISKQAVERNYIKRLLAEAIRGLLPELPTGWDIVLSARNTITSVNVAVLKQDVVSLLQRAQLLKPD